MELSVESPVESNLPEGYTWDAQFENGLIQDGIVNVYDEDGCFYRKLQYQNGKLNGLCLYYDSGVLIEKRTFVDDMEEGWACHVRMDKEIKWFLYKKGNLKMELVKNETMKGYWNAIEIHSHQIVSCCQYNENHKAFEKGFLYNDGKISKVVVFEDGEIIEVLKEFKKDVMVEYDENNMKVYEGGFVDDIDYPREGEGKEYKIGVIVYKGQWKKNKREGYGKSVKNGVAEYIGNWKNDIPNGEGILMRNSEVLYEGKWKKGRFQIEEDKWFDFESGEIVRVRDEKVLSKPIQKGMKEMKEKMEIITEEELKQIIKNGKQVVVELRIMEGCGNELKDALEISGFEKLQSIYVYRNSLRNLSSLRIKNNPQLSLIEIQNGYYNSSTFENVETVEISSKLNGY